MRTKSVNYLKHREAPPAPAPPTDAELAGVYLGAVFAEFVARHDADPEAFEVEAAGVFGLEPADALEPLGPALLRMLRHDLGLLRGYVETGSVAVPPSMVDRLRRPVDPPRRTHRSEMGE